MQSEKDLYYKLIIKLIIGGILIVPFLVVEKFAVSVKIIDIFVKALYSIGSIFLLSIVISFIGMLFQDKVTNKLFGLIFLVLDALAIIVIYIFRRFFSSGYLWMEITTFIVCSIWILIDINDMRCLKSLKAINASLQKALKIHESEINMLQRTADKYEKQKSELVEMLESYSKKSFLGNPMKNMKKELSMKYLDKYKKHIPQYQGSFSGILGLYSGMDSIEAYGRKVQNYIDSLVDIRQDLIEEISSYNDIIVALQDSIRQVQRSYKNVDTLKLCGRGNIKAWEKIAEKDVDIAQQKDEGFKKINKLHNKITKLRRKKRYDK